MAAHDCSSYFLCSPWACTHTVPWDHSFRVGASSVAAGRQSRPAAGAAHPLGIPALDLEKNNLYCKFQQYNAKECFQTKCVIFPREQISRHRRCITGLKGSCSLYECNKSKGRRLHVSWKHVMNRRAGNQIASWKIPTSCCMQTPLPRSRDAVP